MPDPDDLYEVVGQKEDDDFYTIISTPSPSPQPPSGNMLLPRPGASGQAATERKFAGGKLVNIGAGVSDTLTDPKNRQTVGALAASLGASMVAPPAAPGFLARAGVSIIPPLVGGIAGKAWQNYDEGNPVETDMGRDIGMQALFDVGTFGLGETARLAANSIRKAANVGGTLHDAELKLSQAQAEAVRRGTKLGPPKLPEELGEGMATTARNASRAGHGISSAKHEEVFSNVDVVDLSSIVDDLDSLPQGLIPAKFRKNVEKRITQETEALIAQKQAAGATATPQDIELVRRKATEEAFKELDFADVDALASAVGAASRASVPQTLAVGANKGDLKHKYKLLRSMLELTADDSGQLANYKGVKAYHRNMTSLVGERGLGGKIERAALLDPQNVAKEAAKSSKRMEAFQNIVKMVRDPEALKYLSPAEQKQAQESLKAFTRHYYDNVLLEKGALGLADTIKKEGQEKVVRLFAGASGAKTEKAALAQGRIAYKNLVALSEEAQAAKKLVEQSVKDNALYTDLGAIAVNIVPGLRAVIPGSVGWRESFMKHALSWAFRTPERAKGIANTIYSEVGQSGVNLSGRRGWFSGLGNDVNTRGRALYLLGLSYMKSPEGKEELEGMSTQTRPPSMPQ